MAVIIDNAGNGASKLDRSTHKITTNRALQASTDISLRVITMVQASSLLKLNFCPRGT